MDKDQYQAERTQPKQEGEQRPNPFKEPVNDREATPEEEAALEQQRKEALTERD
ncbi:hypothetical protein [Paracnuella aquatica]|uniref:hypothetical protein n=1 Tax=Paracnuella aquatica TaxID=2268757 RepID=UPI0012D72C24|nr:hypothetical protein [Paracnuella aquatica]